MNTPIASTTCQLADSVRVVTDPELRWVDTAELRPNPWNPNRMDDEMYAKAIASIRSFGFIDPITVRHFGPVLEIIDGEHRWRAAKSEGINPVPVIDLGDVTDDIARQLTIVLNETRGQADPQRLGALLRDLAERNSVSSLLASLPYTQEAFGRLTGLSTIDWSDLARPPERPTAERLSAWVERVYRMPKDSAEVIDRAIERFRADGERIPDWKVLELLAADYLGS